MGVSTEVYENGKPSFLFPDLFAVKQPSAKLSSYMRAMSAGWGLARCEMYGYR